MFFFYFFCLTDPEPDPYLWLLDPDPGGPKTYGSYESETLVETKNPHRMDAISIWASMRAVISLGRDPTERFSAGVSLTEAAAARCSNRRIRSRMLGCRRRAPPEALASSGTSTEWWPGVARWGLAAAAGVDGGGMELDDGVWKGPEQHYSWCFTSVSTRREGDQ